MFHLAPFLSYVLVASFTPGPNNIMAMTNANSFGFRKTVNFNLGVAAGFGLIMLLSNYINLYLYGFLPKIQFYMEILGALYMTWLAVKIVKSTPSKTIVTSEEGLSRSLSDEEPIIYDQVETKQKPMSFILGMALQFLNPKGILYGITVTANFIIPVYKSDTNLVLFSIFLALIALISTSSWALFGALFQKTLDNYRFQFNLAMGLLLIYCAVSIFL